jgi:DnaJ-class molecular chaperone
MSARYISKGKPFVEIEKDDRCLACAGSGYYDDNGSPKCGACGGTGKESVAIKTLSANASIRRSLLLH